MLIYFEIYLYWVKWVKSSIALGLLFFLLNSFKKIMKTNQVVTNYPAHAEECSLVSLAEEITLVLKNKCNLEVLC